MNKLAKVFLGGLALAWVGCSSNDNNASGGGGGSDAGSDGAVLPDGAPPPGPASGRYSLAVIVFAPDNSSSTYVTPLDSLDITSVDTSKGREYGGQANIASYDGHLFIADGEAPRITRYTLQDNGNLVSDGAISFANFGVTSVSVDAQVNTFISPTKAYLVGGDGTQIIWNPSAMTIDGRIDTPNLARSGYDLWSSSGFVRGNRLYRVFHWVNWSNYDSPDEQYFATYDTDTNTLVSSVPETRCPTLGARIVSDEAGTAYLSNWFYNVPGTLQRGKAKSCALRLPANSDTLDPNWVLKFSDVTGGHEGAQLTFLGGRRALFATFHEEAMTITPTTPTPYDIASSINWEAWTIDLDTLAAKPLPGIDRMGAQQNYFSIDGRNFLFAPNQAYDSTKAYEISTTGDGSARLAFTIAGWSRAFLKIR